MLSKKILVLPCATQIGVEQFYSLRFNKLFELVGASHNDNDDLYSNFIKLNNPLDKPEFIEEIKSIVSKQEIDILLPSHDEILYILKNSELSNLIPGNDKNVIDTCRYKTKTYQKLNESPELSPRIVDYKIVNNSFLKPDKGQGSKGTLQIETDYLHCELLPGEEYTVDCFSNFESKLIHVNPRLRKKIVNGISETTSLVKDNEFNELAFYVNKVFKFKGSWFFQMKRDKNGILKSFKGHQIMSTEFPSGHWQVEILTLDKQGNLSYKRSKEPEDLKALEAVTNITLIGNEGMTQYQLSPTRKEFKELLKTELVFEECDYFYRILDKSVL